MPDKPARRKKTPRERAEEALAVEERRVTRLTEQRDALKADLDRISRERDQAVVRRDYLAAHPDLPKKDTATSASSISTHPKEQ